MPAVIRQGRVMCTCDVCGRMAHYGFAQLWACPKHRAEVELMWVQQGSPAK